MTNLFRHACTSQPDRQPSADPVPLGSPRDGPPHAAGGAFLWRSAAERRASPIRVLDRVRPPAATTAHARRRPTLAGSAASSASRRPPPGTMGAPEVARYLAHLAIRPRQRLHPEPGLQRPDRSCTATCSAARSPASRTWRAPSGRSALPLVLRAREVQAVLAGHARRAGLMCVAHVRQRPAAARVLPPAGQGRRLRPRRDHRARRQGTQGPGDGAPAPAAPILRAAPRARPAPSTADDLAGTLATSRCPTRSTASTRARRANGPGNGCSRRDRIYADPATGAEAPPPPPRVRRCSALRRRRARGRAREARDLPHPAPLLRDPPPREPATTSAPSRSCSATATSPRP